MSERGRESERSRERVNTKFASDTSVTCVCAFSVCARSVCVCVCVVSVCVYVCERESAEERKRGKRRDDLRYMTR